jgi:hypothetical protein
MQLCKFLAVVVASAAVTACGGSDIVDGPNDPTSDPSSGNPTTSDSTGQRAPVASLQLDEGKTIEFFNYPEGTLIVERGEISTAPVLSRARDAKSLVDVWKTFSPVAAPAVLAELDQHSASSVRPERPSRPAIREVEPTKTAAPANLSGAPASSENICGNGCCDYAYLSTFSECQHPDNGWFHFNYGWSARNSEDVNVYGGFVCSAIGTNKYDIVGFKESFPWGVGFGDHYTLYERNYVNYLWRGTWEYEIRTNVNTSSHTGLVHSYCGFFFDN